MHIITYIIILTSIVLGALNTTWITLNLYQQGKEERFLLTFLITNIMDYLVYEIFIVICKALIYYTLIRDNRVSIWKRVLIVFLALLPWLFGIFG